MSLKSLYAAPSCARCSDSGWVYPTERAFEHNEVIRCPRCYPSDAMRRAAEAPDRTGERP